jgi:predicted AAA+ superfamily ATPase
VNIEIEKITLRNASIQRYNRKRFIYADKTEYICNLLSGPKNYFLSRPRRFGKSLLLSTMDDLFQEDRELFKGLWIDSSDYDFKKHPVVHLNMNYAETGSSEKLKERISRN